MVLLLLVLREVTIRTIFSAPPRAGNKKPFKINDFPLPHRMLFVAKCVVGSRLSGSSIPFYMPEVPISSAFLAYYGSARIPL
jgi:hypothetical protein